MIRKPFVNKTHPNRWTSGALIRQRLAATFFILVLTFSSSQFALNIFWVERAAAAPRKVSALKSEKLQTYKPETGAIGKPINGEEVPLVNDPERQRPTAKTFKEEEVVSERAANRIVTRKSDGSYEAKVFFDAVNYKKNGKWERIDKTLIEDKNAADSGNVFGKLWGNVRSVFTEENTFKVKANDWQARFAPTGDKVGMLRYQKDGFDIKFKPVNARSGIRPVIVHEDGVQKIKYSDVWRGVDLEYEVTGSKLKEFIIIKNPGAETQVAFAIEGAELEEDKENPGGFKIVGLEGISIAPLSVSLNNFGPYTDEVVADQSYKDGKLSISVKSDWLKKLDNGRFPVVIDPSVENRGVGLTYIPYKSDGYVGNSNSFWMNAGTSLDNYKKWRTAFRVDYSFLQGKTLVDAGLFLSRAAYTAESLYYEVSHANCLCYNGINYGAPRTSSWFGQDGWINVYQQYKWLIDRGDWGGWLMLNGEERNHYTLKGFNDNAYVRFYYTTKPPMATPVEPADKQVLVTDQPTLRVNTIAPSDGDRIRYYFRVATNPDAQTGTVFNSGWIDSPTWTLPEGALQDGMTYYWKAYSAKWSSDGSTYYNETGPNWVRSFKIDLRTGKDSTQSYDTAGPISVNLATGNATTSASTHSMAALGGNIGIGIDYNSPYASRQGLVAEYFNNRTFTGSPVVTRVESNVDNRWDLGSPSAGVVPTDNFSARYKGYFVAPKTGTYQFGANNDDTISIKLTINGVQQQVYSNSYCPGVCYGSSVTLNEGDAIPITVEYTEISGAATIRLYVKGAVPEQVIPPDMLRTAPRLVNNYQGLNAHYYYDPGNHTFPSSTNAAFLSRRETKISFNWGSGRPTPVGPADNWMARYDGYITVPTSGTYQFGAHNDDAVRIWINGQLVMDQWADDGNVGTQWGSNVYLDGGKAVPIRVEFYEKGGNAYLYLNVRGAVPEQEVPASWLSVKAPLLPNGWNISLDGDGSLKYDYAIIRPSSVLLVNADGTTHEYKWENNGYKPPVNEYGTLIKNNDGTLTLQDADGMTYVFAADGTLRSVTSPADDRRPVSLKFEYSSTPSRLTRIIDAVDPSRYGIIRYKGDSQCPSAPSGFDAEAPANMICAFETADGRSTKFFYQGGQLARIELPGGEITDLRYDSLGRITQHRSSLAYDVVQAGLRADNAEVTTEISYDALGRVSKITEPAPNAGDARREHTYIYRPGAKTTDLRISNTSEPNGYTTRVEYDSLYRAVKVYDKTGNATQTEYDPVKDLVLSTTTPTGLKSTTIYDANDLPIDSYGPAPKEWFGYDRKPLAQYVGQVPRVQTSYDEGLIGPAVAWYNFKNDSLVGAPRIHATGFNPSDPSRIWINTTNSSSPPVPISPTDGATGVGFRAIGKIYAPATGTYTLSLWHANAARIWVDDKLVLDGWSYRSNTVVNKTAQVPLTANKPTRFVFEYANAGGITAFRLDFSGNGVSITDGTWGSIMRPGYNLTTSTKVYDSQIGDTVATINYGSRPELGQVQSTVVDPAGLNLSTSFTYEPYQTGSLMRQTSKTLPGGTVTNYVYYGATETRDNPCTSETEAHKQAGFLKQKVEADPDGTGPQTSRTSEVVYDDAGRTVASRFNNDPWTCVTYDDRGRAITTVVPTINGRPGRTVTTHYNYQGNPLKTQVVDSVAGTTVSEIDLLGRTISATDQFGNVSTATYDSQGRLVSKTTPLGTEGYTYDAYDRVIEYKHNDTKYATITYDQYSRVQDITYDQAKDANDNKLKLEQIKRDALQRNAGAVFRFSDGTAFDETVDRSQSGKVTSYTDTFGGNTAGGTYTYDKAGRLIAANIDGNTYGYGYGTPTGCTGNFNPNAHKNSNRTSFTVNGVTTTYCYDQGDRLISSGDPQLGTPTYDDHGNTISLSGNGEPIIFTYDAADSNIAIQQGDYKVEYVKTASGSVLRKKEYQDGELTKSYRYLAGGAVLQTCNLTNDNDCVTTDTYLSLPGGVTLTLSNSPASSVSPNTPTIVAPTNGQHFSTSPILNKWDPPAGAENIVKYQVAYHYDDGHSFSNSTCPGLTMDGYSGFIGCRDVTGTERNHTPSVNEQGGLTIWVRAQYSDGSWSDWSAPVHYTYGTAVPPDVGYQGGQQALPSISVVYTIKNFHGDTAMTVGADGIPTSSVFLYEPFGQAAPSTTFGTNSNPTNATDESMGWAANPTRKIAGAFTIPIIQMGARVYLPTAGRFLQVDPIEGGTHNAYVYVTDPVNWHDYSGLCAYIIQCTATIEYFQPAAPVQTVQPASASSVLRSATSRRLTTTTSRAPSVGISIGYVAGGLSIAVDVASDAAAGVGRQSSVFGSKLRQGSSVAGKYLPTVSQLAKNPVIDVVGRVGGPMAAGVEFVGNYFEGDSLGRNALKTGGGVAGGVIGAGVGGAACGVITFGTGGLAGVTCPVLMGGLGAAGSWLGNKAGETLSNLFGW